MAQKQHHYSPTVVWTGNKGSGTTTYKAYSRDHVVSVDGRPDIQGSSDPAFLGDATRYNPEDLLVASISACHMLWYLHLAAEAGVVVTAYRDKPVGVMVEDRERGGWFTGVTLHPEVTIRAGGDEALARSLHEPAHKKCFIANSLNFPVSCEPVISTA